MHVWVVGVGYRTARVELRERIDFQSRGLQTALGSLATRAVGTTLREVAVLSTCNRAELYAACEDTGTARADLESFVSEFHGLDREALPPHIYELADLDAAGHLFPVSAGP